MTRLLARLSPMLTASNMYSGDTLRSFQRGSGK